MHRRVMLIGKTGGGKSSLGNKLIESIVFPVGRGGLSKTVECKMLTVHKGDHKLTVIDTPGTKDVKDRGSAGKELQAVLKHCPKGIDAFIVVMRCDVRMTNEEYEAVEEAVGTFGPECIKRVIVVFSFGDHYNNEETEFGNDLAALRKEVPRLDALLTNCSNRWIMMDNGSNCPADVKERQMTALLGLIDSVAKLNPQRYLKDNLESYKMRNKGLMDGSNRLAELERQLEKLKRLRLKDKLQAQQETARLELQAQQATARLEHLRMEDMLQAQQKDHEFKEMFMAFQFQTRAAIQETGYQMRVMNMMMICSNREMQMQMQQQQQMLAIQGQISSDSSSSLSLTDVLAGVGQGLGQILASPFAGAYKAFKD